jgi:hypothetical protein
MCPKIKNIEILGLMPQFPNLLKLFEKNSKILVLMPQF